MLVQNLLINGKYWGGGPQKKHTCDDDDVYGINQWMR